MIKTIDRYFYKEFGNKLHATRIEKGISLNELSRRVGLSKQALDLFELGQCKIKQKYFEDICKELEIKPDIKVEVKIG